MSPCGCPKSDCSNKRCGCQRVDATCSDKCGCSPARCQNRAAPASGRAKAPKKTVSPARKGAASKSVQKAAAKGKAKAVAQRSPAKTAVKSKAAAKGGKSSGAKAGSAHSSGGKAESSSPRRAPSPQKASAVAASASTRSATPKLRSSPAKAVSASKKPMKSVATKKSEKKASPAARSARAMPTRSSPVKATAPNSSPAPAPKNSPPKTSPAKKSPAKKSPAKKSPAKKSPAKRAPPRVSVAGKSPAKEAKESPPKSSSAKKLPAKKLSANKSPAKRLDTAEAAAPKAARSAAKRRASGEAAAAAAAAVGTSPAKKAAKRGDNDVAIEQFSVPAPPQILDERHLASRAPPQFADRVAHDAQAWLSSSPSHGERKKKRRSSSSSKRRASGADARGHSSSKRARTQSPLDMLRSPEVQALSSVTVEIDYEGDRQRFRVPTESTFADVCAEAVLFWDETSHCVLLDQQGALLPMAASVLTTLADHLIVDVDRAGKSVAEFAECTLFLKPKRAPAPPRDAPHSSAAAVAPAAAAAGANANASSSSLDPSLLEAPSFSSVLEQFSTRQPVAPPTAGGRNVLHRLTEAAQQASSTSTSTSVAVASNAVDTDTGVADDSLFRLSKPKGVVRLAASTPIPTPYAPPPQARVAAAPPALPSYEHAMSDLPASGAHGGDSVSALLHGRVVPETASAEWRAHLGVGNSFVRLAEEGLVIVNGASLFEPMFRNNTVEWRRVELPPRLQAVGIARVAVAGRVYTCIGGDGRSYAWLDGSNEIEVLDVQEEMESVSCGDTMALLLTRRGHVYQIGREHDAEATEESCKPLLVRMPPRVRITQVSCGLEHRLMLSDSGVVFGYGEAKDGRLGIGERDLGECRVQPVVLRALRDERIVAVEAGGYHSAVIGEHGQVWTFGLGKYGQLGHGQQEAEYFPRFVQSLETVRCVAAACGVMFTAFLSSTGDLFVTGFGQFDSAKFASVPGGSVISAVPHCVGLSSCVDIAASCHHGTLLALLGEIDGLAANHPIEID